MSQAAVLRPSYVGIFRGEMLKVARQLSVWVMLLGAVVLLGVIVLASSGADNFKQALLSDPSVFIHDCLVIYGTVFQIGTGIFLLIVSARLFAMEYASGTVRIIYARGVSRLGLLLTKFAALVTLGLLLLAGYVVIVGVIVAITVQAWTGGLSPLQHVPTETWHNVLRAVAFNAGNVFVLVLLAAAATGLGRSLAFALAGSLALFPADNFLVIICSLIARATGHSWPWNDLTQWLLGPNLNMVQNLWLTTRPRPAFASPLVPVDMTHVLVVIGVWVAGFAVIALVRTLRPDVLE